MHLVLWLPHTGRYGFIVLIAGNVVGFGANQGDDNVGDGKYRVDAQSIPRRANERGEAGGGPSLQSCEVFQPEHPHAPGVSSPGCWAEGGNPKDIQETERWEGGGESAGVRREGWSS
jgi:hypothetical protein